MDRLVSNDLGTQIVIELNSTGLFVVPEEVLDASPDFPRSTSSFESTFEEILRESPVEPQFDQPVTFRPLLIVIIRWKQRAVKVTSNIETLAVSEEELSPGVIVVIINI